MAVLPASVFDSQDCSVLGCPNEAEQNGRCHSHLSVATAGRQCKVDGCEEQANTRYTRGIFARLCHTHIEERRAQVSGSGNPRLVAAAAGIGPGSFEQRARTLVPIGRRLDRAVREHERRLGQLQGRMDAVDAEIAARKQRVEEQGQARMAGLHGEVERLRADLAGAMVEWQRACREMAGER